MTLRDLLWLIFGLVAALLAFRLVIFITMHIAKKAFGANLKLLGERSKK